MFPKEAGNNFGLDNFKLRNPVLRPGSKGENTDLFDMRYCYYPVCLDCEINCNYGSVNHKLASQI